jgi:hypothetical protein
MSFDLLLAQLQSYGQSSGNFGHTPSPQVPQTPADQSTADFSTPHFDPKELPHYGSYGK